MQNENNQNLETAPNFDDMSDDQLVAFLDQLREKNKTNQPVSRKPAGTSKKKPEKTIVKLDLD